MNRPPSGLGPVNGPQLPPDARRPSGPKARLVLGATAVGAVALFVLLGRGAPEPPPPAAVLAARAQALQTQAELVKEDARYLLLDPSGATLTLFHGAARLRSWPVLEVEVGARRVVREEEGWHTRRWDGARMEPTVVRDRRVIVSDSVEAPDLTGAVEWIPPLPEEAIPTPPRFVVHYAGGFGLEVLAVRTDSIGPATPVTSRMAHRLRRLLPGNWDRYRIRVSMPAAEAGALYRSLPDSSSFLAVLP